MPFSPLYNAHCLLPAGLCTALREAVIEGSEPAQLPARLRAKCGYIPLQPGVTDHQGLLLDLLSQWAILEPAASLGPLRQ